MDSPLASLSLLSRSLSSHFVRLGLGFVVSYYLGSWASTGHEEVKWFSLGEKSSDPFLIPWQFGSFCPIELGGDTR